MIKKKILTVLLAATVVGGALAPASYAQAQYYDGRAPYRGDWRGHDDWRRHHRHNNGAAIAGGLAAGLIGGLIVGGALSNRGPVYEVAPPQPRCWFESQPVQNQYDDGYHYERVRVCN
ncbi:hypothetical protein [Rhizobium sp. BR 314]|uniref:hypothetical protein n=1 Tax=Rhizobium sp. BR 314 TaxID=3040013 RepID=UPI0039BF4C37